MLTQEDKTFIREVAYNVGGGGMVDIPFDKIIQAYRTSPPGDGKVDTVTYYLKEVAKLIITHTYDANDKVSLII
jgi:hypothetical protein